MAPFKDRPTPDLIVMFLASITAVVVIVTLIGGVVLKITRPDTDVTPIITWVGDITNTLIGAVVGYLAGRGVIPQEHLGKSKESLE